MERVKSLLSEDRREGRHAESSLYLFEYVGVYRIAPLDNGLWCQSDVIVYQLCCRRNLADPVKFTL